MSGHEGASVDALRRAGLSIPEEDHPLLAEHKAAQVEERRRRGEPHGLTAEEVEAADGHEMSLPRYAAMKGVANIRDFDAATKRLRQSGDEAA